MLASTLVNALEVWSAQVAILAAAGALAALAIAHPKGRLTLWQGLLSLILLLPVIEPWKAHADLSIAPAPVAAVALTTAALPSSTFYWRTEYWLWLIAAGAVLRLICVAAGLLRLRQYRRRAHALPGPPLRFCSSAAEWYASDAIPGPVTYGWRRPVILLPAHTRELPDDLFEAIQCHELIHVRRGDWLWVLVETLVRSLLWFHPAIWLIVNRIQLAREQVVDQEAVSLLRNQERYLDALVAVASSQMRPGWFRSSVAPAFLRKRHLLARVEAVVKETSMSRSKFVAAVAAAGSILPMAVFSAMWLFPFVGAPAVRGQAPATGPDSPGVTIATGGPVLHRAPVRLPQGTAAAGRVLIDATLDAQGEVSDAHVVSGPEELRKAALASVLQWRYQPGQRTAQIEIDFGAAAQTSPAQPAVYTAGSRVTNPVPIVRPEPEYTEQARAAKWGGTVLLSIVIDQTGKPTSIKVVKPLGMGLDEKAIEAVSRWRFRPGTKDGQPVPVASQIEVTFRPLD